MLLGHEACWPWAACKMEDFSDVSETDDVKHFYEHKHFYELPTPKTRILNAFFFFFFSPYSYPVANPHFHNFHDQVYLQPLLMSAMEKWLIRNNRSVNKYKQQKQRHKRNKWGIRHSKIKGVLWEPYSYQCESNECAFHNHLSTDLCQYSQWDWLSGPVTDTWDNYTVSLRSVLSPCPSNGNTLRSEMPKMIGRKRGLLSHTLIHKNHRQTIFLTPCFLLLCSHFPPLDFSHFSSALLICYIRSASLSETWSQSRFNCLPSLAHFFSGALIPHIAHISLFHPPTVVSYPLCQYYHSP